MPHANKAAKRAAEKRWLATEKGKAFLKRKRVKDKANRGAWLKTPKGRAYLARKRARRIAAGKMKAYRDAYRTTARYQRLYSRRRYGLPVSASDELVAARAALVEFNKERLRKGMTFRGGAK